MNILQIISTPFDALASGGSSRVAYDISKYLNKKGENVTLITTNLKDKKFFNDKNEMDINILKFDLINQFIAWKYKIYISIKMINYLKYNINNYDIIHLHDLISIQAIYTRYICNKYQKPYLITPHGSVSWMSHNKLLKNIYKKQGLKILNDSKYICVFSDNERKECLEVGLKAEKLVYIPNGFNLQNNLINQPKNLFKNKYNINKKKKIIFFIGRLEKTKGIDLLIDSFFVIQKNNHDLILVISGPDDGFLSHIKEKIKKYNLEKKVIITGLIDEKTKYQAYIDAEVHISPRKWEPFGLTLLESMACGTPVICCTGCGIAKDINNYTGYAVEYNINDMVTAIENILYNKDIKKLYSENTMKLVLTKFNWNTIVDNLLGIYKDIYNENKLIRRNIK